MTTSGEYERDDRWTAVDTYSFSHLHPQHKAEPSHETLEHALSTSKEAGLPDIAVSPSQGKYLKLQAQLVRAKNILEVGTLGGYSTIWLASSGPDVKVLSIEVDQHHAEVARRNIAHAGYENRVEVRLGAGVDVLREVVEEVRAGKREKFDLVFIDADKENNWNYVDAAAGISNKGAAIIVDNVVRKGRVANPDSGDSRIEGTRRVIENIGTDDRLDGVVLQTVGEKDYDGFLLSIVK
ncbi:O-methyltransferas-like protein family 3 [Westerdykella ornata]|uniref:O-methyltransferas-like protein family 3 n=1 Tax=Westerdykella ornata TaxID=318751 RepID=A0A6A6JPI5_WESOR|nr:O-methyltransferas-like protein family 3 [Westerdykella ornata]KAF2277586.1 O-methyltransferas-like protein family 3 [Westerdykella ornata]